MTRSRTGFNIALGSRIRHARILARISQTTLGEALGVSFQQVQKYEKGTDRVSAETLAKLAVALGRPIGDFFEMDAPAAEIPMPGIRDLAAAGASLSRLQPGVRRRVLALVDEIASGEVPQVEEAA